MAVGKRKDPAAVALGRKGGLASGKKSDRRKRAKKIVRRLLKRHGLTRQEHFNRVRQGLPLPPRTKSEPENS